MSENLSYIGEDTINDAIERMKSKGAEFANAYSTLMGDYERVKNNPTLLAKWNTLKKYADGVKATIQTINNSVDNSVNWLKDMFGMNGMSLQGMGNIGVLPLIPIAYVTAAIAALTYIIGEIYKFHALVQSGATSDQLTQAANGGVTGALNNVSSLVKWGGIAFAAYLLYKKYGHHLRD